MGDHLLGFLIVHIHKGENLAIRDRSTSDPYVIVTMGNQKLKTRVVMEDLNPVWNEDLTLSVVKPLPVKLEVYDWDRFKPDDKMGYAEFDFTPFLEAARMNHNEYQDNEIIRAIKPRRDNCLVEKSNIKWIDGEVIQHMVHRLKNVEHGELGINLRWRELLGLLRVHVHRGVDLAIRDWRTSDPYVIITMGDKVNLLFHCRHFLSCLIKWMLLVILVS